MEFNEKLAEIVSSKIKFILFKEYFFKIIQLVGWGVA
jgi:hypothetical protein